MAAAVPCVAQTPASAPGAPDAGAELRRIEKDFIDAYKGMKYEQALVIGNSILKQRPDDAKTMYRLACVHALMRQPDQAMDWIDSAIKHNFVNVDLLERDINFESLRTLPRFRKILQDLRIKTGLAKAEQVWKIHLPAGYDAARSWPLILSLHGFGANADLAIESWKEAADQLGCIIVAPEGPVVVDKGAFQWIGGGEATIKVIKDSLDDVRRKYKVDTARQVVVGFSQGAWMAYQVLGAQKADWCGMVAIVGRYEERWKELFPRGSLVGKRVVLMAGEKDYWKQRMEMAVEVLRQAGAEVDYKVFPGMGHSFPPDVVNEEVRALKYLLEARSTAATQPAAAPGG